MADRPHTGADIARLRRAAAAAGTGRPLAEVSLFVVGARFDNKRRKGHPTGHRQTEILMCERGEPVELRPEPSNAADANAIAVYSSRGVQMGYVAADRTAVIRAAVGQGRLPIAIFQEVVPGGAAIRIGFDGVVPTLPPARKTPAARTLPAGEADWDAVDWIPPED